MSVLEPLIADLFKILLCAGFMTLLFKKLKQPARKAKSLSIIRSISYRWRDFRSALWHLAVTNISCRRNTFSRNVFSGKAVRMSESSTLVSILENSRAIMLFTFTLPVGSISDLELTSSITMGLTYAELRYTPS